MAERLTATAHGDAPLPTAYNPDATAASLWATEQDDELSARTITINRPIEEIYAFVKDRAHLPLIWGDMASEWAAFNIQEEPGWGLSWHVPGEEQRFTGRVELQPAPAGRGTEVSVTFATPSRNPLLRLWDKLNADDPRIQTRRALRRLKQLMETGEVATAAPGPAAPRAA